MWSDKEALTFHHASEYSRNKTKQVVARIKVEHCRRSARRVEGKEVSRKTIGILINDLLMKCAQQ